MSFVVTVAFAAKPESRGEFREAMIANVAETRVVTYNLLNPRS